MRTVVTIMRGITIMQIIFHDFGNIEETYLRGNVNEHSVNIA